MAKSKDKAKAADKPETEVICRNRRARHEYDILDVVDCGIALLGSEVKSIRNRHVTIEDAYAKLEDGEVWLLNADIAEYPQANVMNHDPRRKRKLLLKKREIRKFATGVDKQGQTLVPLEMFFRRGIIKVRLALAKGRREHDKREKLRQEAAGKAIRDALRHRV